MARQHLRVLPDASPRNLSPGLAPERTVGRTDELATLDSLIGRQGGAVVLAGPPGVGKSHLAGVVIGNLARAGAATEVVQGGSASAAVPLGPCAHLVPVLTGDVPLAGLIAGALDRIRRRARHRPVAVLAEDIDSLDDASASLIGHLTGVHGVSVVATARDLSALPSPLASLHTRGVLPSIDVGPLDAGAAAELATIAAGAVFAPDSAHLLFETTGGNPLWIKEIVRSAANTRSLIPTDEGLALPEEAAAGGLDQVLDRRLREVSAAEREAMTLLAVGGALPVTVLEAMVGGQVPARLAAYGLVEAIDAYGSVMVRVAHPTYRGAISRRLSLLETRLVLRRLIGGATALMGSADSTHRDRSLVLRVAIWHAELGEEFDPEALGWASQTVHWGLLELVRRHLNATNGGQAGPIALELGGIEERAAAARQLATAAWRQNPTFDNGVALAVMLSTSPRFTAATVELFERLGAMASDDRERVDFARNRAIWSHWTLGEREVALEELSDYQAQISPPWDLAIFATRAGLMFHSGKVAEALSMLSECQPAPDDPPEVRVVHGSPYAASLIVSGRVREGTALADEMLPIAYRLGERWLRTIGELLILSHWGQGNLGAYTDARKRSLEVARLVADSDGEGRALFQGHAGRCLLAQGKAVSAAVELKEAVHAHGPIMMFGFRPMIYSDYATALAWCGRVEEAEEAVREGRRFLVPPRFFDAQLDLAEVTVLAAQGRRSKAARLAEEVCDRTGADGNGWFAFSAGYLAARLRPTVAVQRSFEAAASMVDVPLAELARKHIAALVDGDVTALQLVAEMAEAMDERLLAAEILEVAVGLAKERRIPHLRLEAALRASQANCEGARSPFVSITNAPAGLTSREREIAGLAATGWTSAAIAEELVLSVRTVESHLYRAFAKLGIRAREELPGALAES